MVPLLLGVLVVKVLSVNAGADTGGVSWGLYRAFEGDPVIELRSAILNQNYIRYPHDLPYKYPDIYPVWCASDVVHLHNTQATLDVFTRKGKQPFRPYVLHHHGNKYRKGHEALNARVAADGARAVVSTVDMLQYGDNLVWVPPAYRLGELAALRKPAPLAGRKLRVGHAPTDRVVKSTEKFLAACSKLDVEPVLVERKSWDRALAIKATVDIFFDQVLLGYGCNAIEAWGMGIPVIAGAPDSTLAMMREAFGTDELPFFEASEPTIADAIRALMDEDVRAEYTARGLAHVEKFHSGQHTRDVLTPIYLSLAGSKPDPVPVKVHADDPPPFTGDRDLVFRVGRPGEELRFAIRSQAKNLPHGRVFTAGVKPDFTTCPHIEVPKVSGQDKYAHAYQVLLAILKNDDLTPEVIISDDDMYLLEPLTEMGSYTSGPIGGYLTKTRAQAAKDTVALAGPDAPCMDVHVPTVINRAELLKKLEAVKLPLARKYRVFWRTLHGPVGPLTHMSEPKIGRPSHKWPDGPWVSSTERLLEPVLPRLRELFPDPSPYEVAG